LLEVLKEHLRASCYLVLSKKAYFHSYTKFPEAYVNISEEKLPK
jgi:hypothetical protein